MRWKIWEKRWDVEDHQEEYLQQTEVLEERKWKGGNFERNEKF